VSLWYTLEGYTWPLVAEGLCCCANQSSYSTIMPVPILPSGHLPGYSPMPGRLWTPHATQHQPHTNNIFHLSGPVMKHLAGKQSTTLTSRKLKKPVKLTIHPYLVLTLQMIGATPLLCLYAFMTCTGTTLPLLVCNNKFFDHKYYQET
jgi:hypothetical protein